MRCILCEHFYRLDLRTSPPRVICRKSGIIDEDTSAERGCELARPKKKECELWNAGGGANWRKA